MHRTHRERSSHSCQDSLQSAGEHPASLLTSQQAASILGITERTLRKYAKRGAIPVVRFGTTVRFDPRDLQEFIDGCKRRPPVTLSPSTT
jgi:excisionase family DNA binding protein